MSSYHSDAGVHNKCIFYCAVLGTSLLATWITWMPLFHVMPPPERPLGARLCAFLACMSVLLPIRQPVIHFRVDTKDSDAVFIGRLYSRKTTRSRKIFSRTNRRRTSQPLPYHTHSPSTTRLSQYTLWDRCHCCFYFA